MNKYKTKKHKTMFTIISLLILGAIVGSIGLIALIVGLLKDVRSIKLIGISLLLILAATVGCYLMGWIIPVIIVIGGFATAFTLVGTSGEDSEDSYQFGIIYMIIGLYLFFNAFLVWFDYGHYTSLAFTSWFLCITCVINAMHCNKDYVPILSMICAILFALFAIYMWMMLDLKGMPIFWSGFFAAIFARSLWWLVYGRKLEAEERLCK